MRHKYFVKYQTSSMNQIVKGGPGYPNVGRLIAKTHTYESTSWADFSDYLHRLLKDEMSSILEVNSSPCRNKSIRVQR
jgi:hypothetical protein